MLCKKLAKDQNFSSVVISPSGPTRPTHSCCPIHFLTNTFFYSLFSSWKLSSALESPCIVLGNTLAENLIHSSIRLVRSTDHSVSGLPVNNFNKVPAISGNALSTLENLLKPVLDYDCVIIVDRVSATNLDDNIVNPMRTFSSNPPSFSMNFTWERPYFSLL